MLPVCRAAAAGGQAAGGGPGSKGAPPQSPARTPRTAPEQPRTSLAVPCRLTLCPPGRSSGSPREVCGRCGSKLNHRCGRAGRECRDAPHTAYVHVCSPLAPKTQPGVHPKTPRNPRAAASLSAFALALEVDGQSCSLSRSRTAQQAIMWPSLLAVHPRGHGEAAATGLRGGCAGGRAAAGGGAGAAQQDLVRAGPAARHQRLHAGHAVPAVPGCATCHTSHPSLPFSAVTVTPILQHSARVAPAASHLPRSALGPAMPATAQSGSAESHIMGEAGQDPIRSKSACKLHSDACAFA